jgi:hypothetical protein
MANAKAREEDARQATAREEADRAKESAIMAEAVALVNARAKEHRQGPRSSQEL